MKIERKDEMSSIISNSMQKNKVLGIAMSLISNGEVVDTSTYGITSSITQDAVQLDTKFEAASLTKPLFAYLVLQLCDRNLINLDTPVVEYLPEYEISRDPRYKLITPRNILCHSSGFENWSTKPVSISFDPGSKFQYSGEAYTYLQKAVERVAGKDLKQLIEEKIFTPLQMNNSAILWTPSVNNQLSYTFDSEGRLEQKRTHSGFSVCTEPNAACSLYTTIGDYTQFILNIIDNKIKPLLPATFNDMINAHNTINEDFLWGLGWGIYQKENKFMWHWGDNGSFKAFVCMDIKTKSGILVFTNSFNGLHVCFDIANCAASKNFASIQKLIAKLE